MLPLSFVRIHRSESLFVQRKRRKGIRFNLCLKTPELMIFERKKAKLPLARNERNETRAICFRGEKSFRARKRKNCQKQSERKKCSNDEISTPHSTLTKKFDKKPSLVYSLLLLLLFFFFGGGQRKQKSRHLKFKYVRYVSTIPRATSIGISNLFIVMHETNSGDNNCARNIDGRYSEACNFCGHSISN